MTVTQEQDKVPFWLSNEAMADEEQRRRIKDARFWASFWNWPKAASILNVPLHQLQAIWNEEMTRPIGDQEMTWFEWKEHQVVLIARAEEACQA